MTWDLFNADGSEWIYPFTEEDRKAMMTANNGKGWFVCPFCTTYGNQYPTGKTIKNHMNQCKVAQGIVKIVDGVTYRFVPDLDTGKGEYIPVE